ncbi:MAG: hypothetical protein ACKOW3_06815 [Hyphomicrobium sp.]
MTKTIFARELLDSELDLVGGAAKQWYMAVGPRGEKGYADMKKYSPGQEILRGKYKGYHVTGRVGVRGEW